MDFDALAEAVAKRIFIPLEASGRHVHLTKEQAMTLFGHPLTPKRELSQPGQFLANERVTVVGPKGEFSNVAVLGPERPEGQVEVSLTDCRQLGITPPVRLSGQLVKTPGIQIKSETGCIQLERGVIVAQRHIHMRPEDAAAVGVADKQVVRVQTFTDRPVTFHSVMVRVRPDFQTSMHIDYDEANAIGFREGDLGRIIP